MYNKLYTLRMQGSVSSIKVVDDKIYAVDNKYNLSIYSNETFEIIERLSLIKDSTERHVYDKSYAISSNLDFYASPPSSSSGNLYYLKDIHVIKKSELSFHEEAVSYAEFSNNSELLAIGADDGVVYFYNLDYEKAILSFLPRSDAISSISFSKNDQHVSVGSFDKSIILYDIESNSEVANVSLSDVPEDVVFLNNKFKVAGITRDKKLFIYDNADGALNYLESSFDEWPTKIERIGSNHLLVSTRADILYLIKINSNLSLFNC
jgi:WD40 repeat protein